MGHSSLVDCSGGQAMSSITTNCGQDANQSSHERLRDVRIPERCALLLGSEEIDLEHLESYARYKPGQSRFVGALNRPLADYIWRKATREQEDGLHSSGSREKPRCGVRHGRLPLHRHRREKPCC
jgi:hypothetical protein